MTFLELLKVPRKCCSFGQKKLNIGYKSIDEFLKSELSCFDQFRMNRRTSYILCNLFKNHGGLKELKICLLKRGLQYS